MLGNPKEIEAELHRQIHGNNTKSASANEPEAVTQQAIEETIGSHRSAKKFPPLKQIRDEAVYRVEKAVIEQALGKTNWNRRETARILVSRSGDRPQP